MVLTSALDASLSVVFLVISYIVGSIPFGLLFGRLFKEIDVVSNKSHRHYSDEEVSAKLNELKGKLDSLVNENVDDNISDVIIDTSEIPDYILNGNITGLTYYGSSLVLQGETSIKHYFEIADEKDSESILNDYTFICEGEEIKPVIREKM